jgi:hypothetical protein
MEGKRLLEHRRVEQAERVVDRSPDEAVRVTVNLASVNTDTQPDLGGFSGQPVVTAEQCVQMGEEWMDHGDAGPPGRDDHQDSVASILVEALLPGDGRIAEGTDKQPVESVAHGELHLVVARAGGGEARDVDYEDYAVPRAAARPLAAGRTLEPKGCPAREGTLRGNDGAGEQHGKCRDG